MSILEKYNEIKWGEELFVGDLVTVNKDTSVVNSRGALSRFQESDILEISKKLTMDDGSYLYKITGNKDLWFRGNRFIRLKPETFELGLEEFLV